MIPRTGTSTAVRRAPIGVALILALSALGASTSLAAAAPPPVPPSAPPIPVPTSARESSRGGGSTHSVPVLMYHRITCAPRDARLPGLWVCPRVFDRTMRLLEAAGWDTITSAQLAEARAAGRPLPRRTFVVVFDDGDRDGYDHAYPVLERYGFEGVFAVVVGRVGVKRNAMTWDELIELRDAGHEIANHSMSHVNLASLGAAGLAREVARSGERLRERLGAWPRTFVYPYGSWNGAALDAVRAAHHRIAYTTISGASCRHSQRLASPRVRISRGDSPERVLARISAFD